MDAGKLKALQAPLKDRYRAQSDAALLTLRARGRIGVGITCRPPIRLSRRADRPSNAE